MKREIRERTILDGFAEDFVDIVEKHAKLMKMRSRIKANIRRLRLS
jgi:hypothetical protein